MSWCPFSKTKGAAAATLGITTPDVGGVQLEASGPANYLNRQANPSLTPTFESQSIRPFDRRDVTLTPVETP